MTEIRIDSIEDGASYDDAVWDYWITASLKNKTAIRIFDPEAFGFVLKKFIGNWIGCEIKALFLQTEKDEHLVSFTGSISMNNDAFIFKNDNVEIILSEDEVKKNNVILDAEKTYYFGRLDITKYELLS